MQIGQMKNVIQEGQLTAPSGMKGGNALFNDALNSALNSTGSLNLKHGGRTVGLGL